MKGHNLQLWAGIRSEVIARVRSGPMANRARLDQTMSHLISSSRISRTISTRKALRKELRMPRRAAEVVRSIVCLRTARDTVHIARDVKNAVKSEYTILSEYVTSPPNDMLIDSVRDAMKEIRPIERAAMER